MANAIRHSVSSDGENIYWPGDAAPRGGVVCLHGSEGGLAGWNDLQCSLFAAHGFVALAHNYTRGRPLLTRPDIDDVPLDGTEAALAALRAELAGHGCGTALYGVSRGAEHALLVAQLLAEDGCRYPDAVALHSPPDAAWPAFIVADFQTGRPWAGDTQRPSWSWRGGHDRTRPGTALGTGTYPGPVFLAQGTEDEIWDADMARRLVARMTEAGGSPEAHFFEGERHQFGAAARNREWELMTDFLGRHLAPDRPR